MSKQKQEEKQEENELLSIGQEFFNENKVRELLGEVIQPILIELTACQRISKIQATDVKRVLETQKYLDNELVNLNKKLVDQSEIKKQLRLFEVQMNNQELILKKRHEKMKDSVSALTERINEINQHLKQVDNQFAHRDEKIDQINMLVNNYRDKLQESYLELKEENDNDFKLFEERIKELENKTQGLDTRMENLTENLESQTVSTISEIFQKFKAEEGRYDEVKLTLVEFPKMQADLKQVMGRMQYVEKEFKTTVELQVFVERCIPILTHFQISEALQTVFEGDETFQKQLYDFENAKLREFQNYNKTYKEQEINLHNLKIRVMFLLKALIKHSKGVHKFLYGRDYNPEMPIEELEYLNQMVIVSLDERERLINALGTHDIQVLSYDKLTSPKSNFSSSNTMPLQQQQQNQFQPKPQLQRQNISRFGTGNNVGASLQQQDSGRYLVQNAVKTSMYRGQQGYPSSRNQGGLSDEALIEINKMQLLFDAKLKDIERQMAQNERQKLVSTPGAVFKSYFITKKYTLKDSIRMGKKSRSSAANAARKMAKLKFELSKEEETLRDLVIQRITQLLQNENINMIAQLKQMKKFIDDYEYEKQMKDSLADLDKDLAKSITQDDIDKIISQLKDQFDGKLKDQLNKHQQRSSDDLTNQHSKLSDLKKELAELKDKGEMQKWKVDEKTKEMVFEINQIRDRLKFEYDDFFQYRKKIKSDINYDSNLIQNKIHEFERTLIMYDGQITNLSHILNILLEVQSIEHLMVSQDLEDRKQIGLFGTKKNADIIGNASQSVTVQKGINQNLQDMRSFNKTEIGYHHQNHNRSKTIENLNNTSFLPSQNQGPNRNTIFVDRNCISCSGNSSVLLQHIKVACLSYQNNPVTYKNSVYTMNEINGLKYTLLNECQRLLDPVDWKNNKSIISDIEGPILQSKFKQNKTIEDNLLNRKNHVIQVVLLQQQTFKKLYEKLKPLDLFSHQLYKKRKQTFKSDDTRQPVIDSRANQRRELRQLVSEHFSKHEQQLQQQNEHYSRYSSS
ncbi:UNKNOWN [Stylonychia lemnae]|uniref:Uncharacterized protein n=1 Tax=Stylonychia lemnae TaxID=5949 RepID=A0A078B361_STYLE|nr:UNKNOWN [Stylonychia lemnae]|eukprot:CDW87687.1 UNKNOWN [Stylonychia lemnae]